jgi:hypothetical protein
MQPFVKKDETPDFSHLAAQKAYVDEAEDSKDLMQKEFDVNLAEQNLLQKRIGLMKQLANDLPSSDPQYSMLLLQIRADLVELDELKIRVAVLTQMLQK